MSAGWEKMDAAKRDVASREAGLARLVAGARSTLPTMSQRLAAEWQGLGGDAKRTAAGVTARLTDVTTAARRTQAELEARVARLPPAARKTPAATQAMAQIQALAATAESSVAAVRGQLLAPID